MLAVQQHLQLTHREKIDRYLPINKIILLKTIDTFIKAARKLN